MSRGVISASVVTSLFLTGFLILSGCADKKKPEPVATAQPAPPPPPATLSQMKSELLAAKAQMDVTNQTLGELAKSSNANAQANYDKFTTEFAKFQSLANVCRSRNQDLKTRTQAYFDSWNKQAEINNPELRRRATEQRVQAEKTFSTIKSEVELAKLSFDPYVAQLTDVSAYLKGNLSPAALASADELVTKANANSKELSGHIDTIVTEINKIMSASGEAPAAAKPADQGK